MTEVALIADLMGMGYDFTQARRIVEGWEVNESFPGMQYSIVSRYSSMYP